MGTKLLLVMLLCTLVAVTLSQDSTDTGGDQPTVGPGDEGDVVEVGGGIEVEGGATQTPSATQAQGDVTQGDVAKDDGVTSSPGDDTVEGTAAGETKPAGGVTSAPSTGGADQPTVAAGASAADTTQGTSIPAAGGGTSVPAAGAGTSIPAAGVAITTGGTAAPASPSGVTGGQETDGVSTRVVVETTEAPLVGIVQTTAGKEEAKATTEAAETETMRSWPADDPCSNHTLLSEDERYYSNEMVEGQELSDTKLAQGWFAFNYKDEPAIITPVCIKEQYCSTYMPYHLESEVEPEIGETLDTAMCGPGSIAGRTSCCLQQIPVKIRNCQTRYVYYLKPIHLKSASVCIQLPEEEVPLEYHAIPTEAQVTTAKTWPTLPATHYSKLTDASGIVTVEFEYPDEYKESNYMVDTFDSNFRRMVAEQLNNMNDTMVTTPAPPVEKKDDGVVAGETKPQEGEKAPETTKPPTKIPNIDSDAGMHGPEDMKRKRRHNNDYKYTEDDVKYVGPTPQDRNNVLQVACYVDDPETGVVPAEKLVRAVEELDDNEKLEDKLGMPVIDVYEGLPNNIRPATRVDNSDVWVRHRDLLITLIVLSSICLFIILLGVCCLKCRSNQGSWDREDEKLAMEQGESPTRKQPLVHENPIPDSEIMRGEAPMLERENPAVTSNGGGQHISKMDDNDGWIVPIDELSTAEKEKPEVEDTKL